MGRRLWSVLTIPGVAWLSVFFLFAFYAVGSVGLGNVTELYQPVPHWNPLDWNVGYLLQAIDDVLPGGRSWDVFIRTLIYVAAALAISLAIGYPVAYYTSRHAGRRRGLILLLLVLPFWISYLMRMFAWTNLLDSNGYAAKLLGWLSIDGLMRELGLLDGTNWLGGQHATVIMALVYGYVPYLILPLYASLDRIDQRLIALPMFGDYYTPDLMSGSPRTAMLGNAINGYVQGGPDKSLGASLTLLLAAFLLVFMLYYLRVLRRDQEAA